MNPKSKKKSPKPGADPLTLKDYQDYCDKFYPKRCPHPNCPENDRYPFDDLRECTQFQPIWISIPAGGHVHIHCPVHPKFVVYGSPVWCGDTTTRGGNGGCVYEHDSSKDLTFDSTRPFGTATGDNIRDSYKVIC